MEQRTKEIIFTCLKCEANYQIDYPIHECPVCGWKRKEKEDGATY